VQVARLELHAGAKQLVDFQFLMRRDETVEIRFADGTWHDRTPLIKTAQAASRTGIPRSAIRRLVS
jgi:hypothetical protein